LGAIEQKYEYLCTEMQRLRVENAEYKEKESQFTRRKNELEQALMGNQQKYDKLRIKKTEYKRKFNEVPQFWDKDIGFEKIEGL